jgi:hypothetical protein
MTIVTVRYLRAKQTALVMSLEFPKLFPEWERLATLRRNRERMEEYDRLTGVIDEMLKGEVIAK